MLEIIAVAKEDGWAFVRNVGKIHLVRPPYTMNVTSIVDQHTVDKAVAEHGFACVKYSFPDWKILIEFLNQAVADFRATQEQTLDADTINSQILELAPEEILSGFLDRVEQELLPSHKWDHATNLLMSMLKIPSIRENSQLGDRVTRLLEKTQIDKEQANHVKVLLTEEASEVFVTRTIQRYGKGPLYNLLESIRQQGQTFNFAP